MNSLCISASLLLLTISCASAQGLGFGNIFGGGAAAVGSGFGLQGDSLISLFDNNAFAQQAALNKGSQNQEQIAANENLQVGANTAEQLQAADQTQANSALRAANQGNFANVNQIDGAANVNSASKTVLAFDTKNVYNEDAALSYKDANVLEDNNILQFQDQFLNSNFLNAAAQDQLQALDQSQLGIAANNQNVLQVAEQVADQGQTQIQGADRSNFFGSNFDQSLFGGFGGGNFGVFRRR